MPTVEKNIEALSRFGYDVSVAAEGYADDGYTYEDGSVVAPQKVPTLYSVEGFGVSLQVSEVDTEAWDRLANPDAHALRQALARSTDPNDSFNLTPSKELTLALKAGVSCGDLTQAEADKLLTEAKSKEAKA